MPSDIRQPAAANKKVPLWLWVILVLVCAAGVALLVLFRSSQDVSVKEKLTPHQEEKIFSDIQEENLKAPEPENTSEPLLPQE